MTQQQYVVTANEVLSGIKLIEKRHYYQPNNRDWYCLSYFQLDTSYMIYWEPTKHQAIIAAFKTTINNINYLIKEMKRLQDFGFAGTGLIRSLDKQTEILKDLKEGKF